MELKSFHYFYDTDLQDKIPSYILITDAKTGGHTTTVHGAFHHISHLSSAYIPLSKFFPMLLYYIDYSILISIVYHNSQARQILNELSGYFEGLPEQQIATFLSNKGYHPLRTDRLTIEFLKNHHVWDKTKQLLQKYKKEWSGSDVPIFIFPIPSSMFRQADKNGYSFEDKIS